MHADREGGSVLAVDSSRRHSKRVAQTGVQRRRTACRRQVIGCGPKRECDVTSRLMTRLVWPGRRPVNSCLFRPAGHRPTESGMDRWMDQANGTRERSFKRVGRWAEKDNKQNSQNIDFVLVLFYFQGARYLERWDGKNGIFHFSPSPALTPSTQSTYLQNKTKINKQINGMLSSQTKTVKLIWLVFSGFWQKIRQFLRSESWST